MDRDIDYVIAVAECRSISQAAEVLYVSQPSLSRYISNLEDELGVSLFIRTINGTELTEAGKIYVKYAKEIKLLRGTMDHELRIFKQSNIRHIRVGMTLNAASLSAFNVAEKVKKRYPDCGVDLFNIMSKDIEETLRTGKYDFAIGPNMDMPPEFVNDIISRDPYILIVPEQCDVSRYAKRKEGCRFPFLDLRKLPPMDFILQEDTTFVRKGIDGLFKHLKCTVTPKLQVTSSTLAIQAVENGIGGCIVAMGHLAYINHIERLRLYQVSEEQAPTGIIHLVRKTFTEEEKYCISCIKKALLAGEEEIIKRLEAAGKLRV